VLSDTVESRGKILQFQRYTLYFSALFNIEGHKVSELPYLLRFQTQLYVKVHYKKRNYVINQIISLCACIKNKSNHRTKQSPVMPNAPRYLSSAALL